MRKEATNRFWNSRKKIAQMATSLMKIRNNKNLFSFQIHWAPLRSQVVAIAYRFSSLTWNKFNEYILIWILFCLSRCRRKNSLITHHWILMYSLIWTHSQQKVLLYNICILLVLKVHNLRPFSGIFAVLHSLSYNKSFTAYSVVSQLHFIIWKFANGIFFWCF